MILPRVMPFSNLITTKLMKRYFILLALSLFAVRMSAQAPASYSVEKDIIHSYLTDFDYDTMDINVSLVEHYFDMPHVTDASKPVTDPVNRLDVPKPFRITWTHQDGAESQRVEVSHYARFNDSIVFTVNKDSAGYDLYNMVPGERVYYRVVSVKDDVESTVASGSLLPTGMLRWIYAEGTWNVRDMGGWPGLGGHPIKYGQIFRGGQLTNPKDPFNVLLTASGIEAMRNAGIRTELDLRSSSQAHYSYASFAKKNAENKYDVDFLNISESVNARMWKYDANDANIRELQYVINQLKAGKPVFYHCQNGADRTGTLGLLIGALLGMSDGDLAKDYELTTFCQEAAVDFDNTEVGFARLRNYEGKKGSVDNSSNPKDYMFAPVLDKLAGIEDGATTQMKIYNFFKNGVGNTKISESDLDWFIKYMVDYVIVKSVSTVDFDKYITMQVGECKSLEATVSPANATEPELFYSSSDTNIVKVSADGIMTAVGRGTVNVKVRAGGVEKVIPVSIPLVEAVVPTKVNVAGTDYNVKDGDLKIKDGSFEYLTLSKWNSAAGTTLSKEYFSLKRYVEDYDSVYLESKASGDGTSPASLRAEWTILKNRTYVLGFRIKNSTAKETTNTSNLKVFMTKNTASDTDANAIILPVPAYDGNWKEVQLVFTNTSMNRLRILFTELSQDGNNTCLDNFYLVELDTPSGYNLVDKVNATPAYAKSYDINGREVDVNSRGLKILDGKKVLISE